MFTCDNTRVLLCSFWTRSVRKNSFGNVCSHAKGRASSGEAASSAMQAERTPSRGTMGASHYRGNGPSKIVQMFCIESPRDKRGLLVMLHKGGLVVCVGRSYG